jgi:hypothetical protein
MSATKIIQSSSTISPGIPIFHPFLINNNNYHKFIKAGANN